jgi:hypothetical protein
VTIDDGTQTQAADPLTETSLTPIPLSETADGPAVEQALAKADQVVAKAAAEAAAELASAAAQETKPAKSAAKAAPTETADPAAKASGKAGAGAADEPPSAPPAENVGVVGHRRGPGIWLPLIVFAVLLVAGAVVGRFVVPRNGPDPGARPSAGGTQAAPSATGEPSPTPSLPTPPVRPADQLADWAGRVGAAVNVPAVAIQAYGYAELFAQNQYPSCHLRWSTLAGLGEVESSHGQAEGAVLQATGRSAPILMGPLQDGKGGRALVNDTDVGAFDGDATYDRALGPLRLMPSEWREFGIDGDADGIVDPFDIDDASVAMARLLCAGNDDMSQLTGWNKAVARHHPGDAYASSIFKAANSYGQRTRDIG